MHITDVNRRARHLHFIGNECGERPGQNLRRDAEPRGKNLLLEGQIETIGVAELGAVSETFSRTRARFRDQGLATVKKDVISALSPSRLDAILRRNLGE